MKEFVLYLAVLIVTTTVTACATVEPYRKMPSFDQAMLLPGIDHPKLFMEDVRIETAVTPYAVISRVVGQNAYHRELAIKSMWLQAAELKADILVIRDAGETYAGSSSTSFYLGNGVSTAFSVPSYASVFYGTCYRVNPAKLGIQTDKNLILVNITNENLYKIGILEGDRFVSINGAPYTTEGSPELLKIKPDEDVKILAIRPGTGKIERSVRSMNNDSTYLSIPDLYDWNEVRKNTDKKCYPISGCE